MTWRQGEKQMKKMESRIWQSETLSGCKTRQKRVDQANSLQKWRQARMPTKWLNGQNGKWWRMTVKRRHVKNVSSQHHRTKVVIVAVVVTIGRLIWGEKIQTQKRRRSKYPSKKQLCRNLMECNIFQTKSLRGRHIKMNSNRQTCKSQKWTNFKQILGKTWRKRSQ